MDEVSVCNPILPQERYVDLISICYMLKFAPMLEYPALARRVIFFTGDTLNSASMTFLEQCGRPWLRKPCTIAEVRRAIQQMLTAGDSAGTP